MTPSFQMKNVDFTSHASSTSYCALENWLLNFSNIDVALLKVTFGAFFFLFSCSLSLSAHLA